MKLKPLNITYMILIIVVLIFVIMYKLYLTNKKVESIRIPSVTDVIRRLRPRYEPIRPYLKLFDYHWKINRQVNNRLLDIVENADLINPEDSSDFNNAIRDFASKYNLDDVTILVCRKPWVLREKYDFFGIIAKDSDGKGIISLRGTSVLSDWMENISYVQVPLTECKEFKNVSNRYKVCKGDLELFGSLEGRRRISKTISDWVKDHPEVKTYSLNGHSLGGALTQIASFFIRKVLNKNVEYVYLYASKRTFNRELCTEYNKLLYNRTYNFFLNNDIVPMSSVYSVLSTSQIVGFSINPDCFQCAGIQFVVDYTGKTWPANESLVNKHHNFFGITKPENSTVWTKYFTEFIDNPPNTLPSNNVLSRPQYNKFVYYNNLLLSFYRMKVMEDGFRAGANSVPDDIMEKFRSFIRANSITNAVPLLCTDRRTVLWNKSYICGFIGIKDNKCIIGFGSDYENFPIEQPFSEFLFEAWDQTVFNDLLPDRFRETKISKIIRDYYFEDYNNTGKSIKKSIDSWLNQNQNITKFYITGHGFGGCFAQVVALHLYSKNKEVVELYLYGSLKLGDVLFAENYDSIFYNNTYLFQNFQDPYVFTLPHYITDIENRLLAGDMEIFKNVGKIYGGDIPFYPGSCNGDLLARYKTPLAYTEINRTLTWKSIIEKNFDTGYLVTIR